MYDSAYVTRTSSSKAVAVAVLRGGDQLGHVLWHRALRPPSEYDTLRDGFVTVCRP